jgi:hypothetical protein
MHPERRQHVRILTIKNFGLALLVLLVVIAAANIISEMRPTRSGEYGRLTIRDEPVVVKHPPQVVTEAEVPEGPATMPPASLLSVATVPPPVQTFQQTPKPAGEGAGAPLSHAGGPVTIVGGPDGVHVESAHHEATPKLSGGIFRQ